MRDKVEKIARLLDKYLQEDLSPDEKSALDGWIAEDEKNRLLFQKVTDKKVLARKLKAYSATDSQALWQSTLQKINNEGKVIEMPRKKEWVKYAVAASVISVISLAAWFFIGKPAKNSGPEQVAVTPESEEVVPGSSKATVILADGSTRELGAGKTSIIPKQGSTDVTITNEGLVYIENPGEEGNTGEKGKSDQFNEVLTPKGGEYRVTLPDGSKVWLNAASSLRFPIAFAGNERHVQLTGEAYFEVEKKGGASKIPFTVSIINEAGKECKVEVLGTRFNVMAYKDEASTQTTLLEGSVKIIYSNGNETIKPGEQASVNNNKINVKGVDPENVIAWKKGAFSFSGNSTQTLLRQIGRWYDVEVKYEGEIPEHSFNGGFSRSSAMSNVITFLKYYNVNARLEKRTLIVTP